jgi:hypothetical protein
VIVNAQADAELRKVLRSPVKVNAMVAKQDDPIDQIRHSAELMRDQQHRCAPSEFTRQNIVEGRLRCRVNAGNRLVKDE